MTESIVRALTGGQLDQVIAWAQDEKKERAEKYKRETIAKIKEMASSAGVSITIAGRRGRPSQKASGISATAAKA